MQKRALTPVYIVLFLAMLFFPFMGNGQPTDTLVLTIPDAERIFLEKNLDLLANHFNIDISRAQLQQARAWDNPVLNSDQTLYDGRFFRHKVVNGQEYGQVFLQVQQLIRTAGKIRKQTLLAEDNVRGSGAQFNDLVRNLRFTLAVDMNELARLQHIASVYAVEMETMQGLVRGMDEMYKIGDVSQKEQVRIRALLFSLQGDYNENQRQQVDIRKELATLLQLSDSLWIQPKADQLCSEPEVNGAGLGLLKDSALVQRPDLAALRVNAQFQQHNLALQKALALPDFSLGVEYDHLNSYVRNYYGLDISLPLPVFNRNRGNIHSASFAVKQADLQKEQLQLQVGNEVAAAWLKLKYATQMLDKSHSQLQDSFETLMQHMTASYKARQVGLVEFIDFFDAYRETRSRQWRMVADQRNAAAELNYVTNHQWINL